MLSKISKNNKGGDVGMVGMILILVVVTVMTIAIDMFANMISKEYVIEKMQAAQSYSLVKNYDTTNSTQNKVKFMGEAQIRSDYLSYLGKYLNASQTVFSSISFSDPRIIEKETSYSIEGKVTYTPHQFIRNPSQALFPGAEVSNPKVTTLVRTILTAYTT